MKALIVYDSYFGNTEKVAKAIEDALQEKQYEVSSIKAADAAAKDLDKLDLLIVGSPTKCSDS